MKTKYSKETFNFVVGEKVVTFYCYTSDTRNGFCHRVYKTELNGEALALTDTIESYYNRSWESYKYQTALRSASNKLKCLLTADELTQLKKAIDTHSTGEIEKVDAMIAKFQSLSDDSKKHLQRAFADGVHNSEQLELLNTGINIFGALDILNGKK